MGKCVSLSTSLEDVSNQHDNNSQTTELRDEAEPNQRKQKKKRVKSKNKSNKNKNSSEDKEEEIPNEYTAVFFDKSSPFKCIKHIDQKTKNIVFGYINDTDTSLISSTNVPNLIRYWCLLYYYEFYFNNLIIGMEGEIIAVHTSIHHENLHQNGHIIKRGAKFTLNSLEIKTKPTDHCHYIEIKHKDDEKSGYIDIESTNLYQPTLHRLQNEKRIQLFENVNKNNIDTMQYPKNRIVSKYGARVFGSFQRTPCLKAARKLRRIDEIYLIAPPIDELRFGDIICVYAPGLQELTWVECKHTTYLRDIPDSKATDIMGTVTSKYGGSIHASIDPSIYIGRYKSNETFRLMSFKAKYSEFKQIFMQVKSTWSETNYPDQVVWISVKATDVDSSRLQIE